MWIRISQPSGDCTTTCQQPCSTRNPLFISNSFWPTQSPPGLGGRRVVTKPLNGTEAGSGRSASQWRGIRHSPPPATKIPEEPFFLLHFRHLCASAQSRFVAEGEPARLAGRKAVRLDQAFPVRTKPPAATDATRGQTPWPLSFQDHLVLETNPRFRLILYWITLPLALRRSSCYDELTTSLAAVSRPAAHNRTPSRIAPFLFVSACHCCIGSNDRGARVCVSCIRRRNSFCGVSTSFRYTLWVVASRLRNRNVRLRASCEWPPSRPTREFIAVAAFGRQLRESDALRSPTPRQSSNLGIRFLVDAFARPQHLVAT